MLRSRILIPLAAVLAVGVAAPAGASTYCVNDPSCIAAGGTDKGNDATALASALATAQALGGRDRVEVGAGSYARAGGFTYTGGAGNELDLVGAGHAQSVVTNTTTGTTLAINAPASTVTGFGVDIAPSNGGTGFSLWGTQSVAEDIAVTGQAGTVSATGASASGGATLSDSTVTGTGNQLLYGVVGDGTLRDSTIAASDFTYGVYGLTDVHRVAIAAGTGVIESGGPPSKIDQVVIRVPAGGQGIASGSTSFGDTVMTADHVTILGVGDLGSQGAVTSATAGGPTAHNGKLILRSSIVRGVGHALARHADHGAADIEVDHSDFDPATTLTAVQAGGSGAVTDKGGNVNVDPMFQSASDFHLLVGSPVIDAGAPAVQSGESVTDLGGAPRLSGSATDMGAFEYAPPAPPPPPPPSSGQGGTETSGTDGATSAATPIDAPPADAPPATVPPAPPASDPPAVPVQHKRTCAQIAKAKHGRKARAKAKARCLRKQRKHRTHR
jgi:hypothetical protein